MVSLSEVNRCPPKLIDNIEKKVCHNLGMEYEIEIIVDILFSYAKLNKGSKVYLKISIFTILCNWFYAKDMHTLIENIYLIKTCYRTKEKLLINLFKLTS